MHIYAKEIFDIFLLSIITLLYPRSIAVLHHFSLIFIPYIMNFHYDPIFRHTFQIFYFGKILYRIIALPKSPILYIQNGIVMACSYSGNNGSYQGTNGY